VFSNRREPKDNHFQYQDTLKKLSKDEKNDLRPSNVKGGLNRGPSSLCKKKKNDDCLVTVEGFKLLCTRRKRTIKGSKIGLRTKRGRSGAMKFRELPICVGSYGAKVAVGSPQF